MCKTISINPDLTWVGALDPNLRIFDIIMETKFGTTYNSYVLKGTEGVAIFETVKEKFFDEHLEKIKSVVKPEDITYIVGHLHKSFNENEVDGISGDYIEAIDELTNIFILDSSGCTIDNNTSYMLIDINKSLMFSKINITYDYNKFINKELEKEFPDKETILKLFYGINK